MSHKPRLRQVMLLVETSRAYGRGLVEGIGRYVEEHGPWSIYFEERGLLDPLPKWLKNWQGDGIISRTVRKADIERLQATHLPVVELYANPGLGLPRAYPDQSAIARLAAEHFLDRGFRRFAFFCTDRAWWMNERRDVFVAELQRSGFACECFPAHGQRDLAPPTQSDQREVARWLSSLPKPCGVFCASDLYAARLLDACRTIGIAVPEEIAVLGVDNDPVICSVTFPSLSSIELGSRRIGYEAAALLDHMMSGQQPTPGEVRMPPERVVCRQSTDVLAIEDPDVARAIRYIREHAANGLRIEQLAEATGICRRTLQQRFQRCLQRTPKHEILRVQMERAKLLLCETDMPVETVCQRSGFVSFKYFARAFHRVTGMTPRGYRKAHGISAPRIVRPL